MSNETIAAIKARKFFYRDNFRRLTNVVLAMLGIIFLLVLAIVLLAVTRSERYYFATSYVSELIPLKDVTRGTGLKNPEKELTPPAATATTPTATTTTTTTVVPGKK